MTNIDIIKDTLYVIEHNYTLNSKTSEAINSTAVYGEGFMSCKKPEYASNIHFEENLTLIAARRLVKEGHKTCVLNFANPVEPGGGVLRGANAQEEYLCRASNLYPCLISKQASAYYDAHKSMLNRRYGECFPASDRTIYTKGVTVIREDRKYDPNVFPSKSSQEYIEDRYSIDVLTCAAPILAVHSTYPEKQLREILGGRVRNIFEVAIENDVEAIVLGAFGCGAFHNPPITVAEVFSDVLSEKRYLNAFKEVVFAVKRTGSYCPNIEAFEIAFSCFPPSAEYVFSTERNKRRFWE
ncbi:MAG: TIGR02452 family protein [Clostridia bacterium]|nr:TIGR02452 family protein [Clostridia bacterium]